MQNPPQQYTQNLIKQRLMFAFGFSFITSLLMLAVPIYSLQVFDRVLNSFSLDTLYLLTVIALWLVSCHALVDWSKKKMLIHLAHEIDSDWSLYFFYTELNQTDNKEAPYKEKLQAFTSFLQTHISGLLDSPWTLIFLIVLFVIHPSFAIIASAGVCGLVLLAICNLKLGKQLLPSTPISEIEQTAHQLKHHFKLNGALNNLAEHWFDTQQPHKQAHLKHKTQSTNIQNIAKLLRLIIQIGIIFTGVYLVLQQQLSAGGMIAASMIAGRALAPSEQAVNSLQHWLQGISATRSFLRAVQEFENTDNKTELPNPHGILSIKNVMHRHPAQETVFLKSINTDISPGDIVALVGASGSGKSSLLQLISGVIKPTAGEITIDNAHHDQWPEQMKKHLVNVYDSSSSLFHAKVKDNITQYIPCDDQALVNTCKLIGIHNLILSWPMGYDTVIDSRSVFITDSQKQQLLIARALHQAPHVLILDGADRYLDTRGEQHLIQALKNRSLNGKITIISATKMSVLQHVSRILIMHDGRIHSDTPAKTSPALNPTNVKQAIS